MKRICRQYVLIVVALLATGAAWWCHREAKTAQAALQRAQAQLAQEQAALGKSRARLPRVQQDVAALKPHKPATQSAGAPKTGAKIDWVQWGKDFEARLRDPKVQLRDFAIARLKLRSSYYPLYAKLHLSPAQIDTFEATEARYAEDQQDIYAALVAAGLTLRNPSVASLYDRAREQEESAQRALLGEEGFSQYQAYRRTLPARQMATGFAGLSTLVGEPMTAAQAEQLAAAIATGSKTYVNGGAVNAVDLDWSKIDAAASAVLSPTQLQLFQTSEVSGGVGGRFWSGLNRAWNQALNQERAAAVASGSPHG